jgi:aryl-alcohol dehydrogenase-like predicted oxidoreductase
MIPGWATAEGTGRYAARFPHAAPGHFRPAGGWTVSSLGLGTYAGGGDGPGYAAAVGRALELGCNVLDTAVAYRHQRSEREVGLALGRLVRDGIVRRDEVVLSSKAGFIPFDAEYPGGVEEYTDETFVRTGVVPPDEVVAPGHCIAPRFLRHQIEVSRANLRCQTIDVYYLHNPETQLAAVGGREFTARLRRAFEALEAAVADGAIRVYGASTWGGFRVPPGAADALSFGDLVRCATEVGGADHHFRAVMLPFSLAMPEGVAVRNQQVAGRDGLVSPVRAAREFGLTLTAGSPLWLGRLARDLPERVRAALTGAGVTTDAQRALQFARSVPGVAAAHVGMRDPAHVEENLALRGTTPLAEDQFLDLLE